MKIKKNILITGGLGFIGQNLVKFFQKKHFNIHIIDNKSSINSNTIYLKKKISKYLISISLKQKKYLIFLILTNTTT